MVVIFSVKTFVVTKELVIRQPSELVFAEFVFGINPATVLGGQDIAGPFAFRVRKPLLPK